jgi:hypothetical protein
LTQAFFRAFDDALMVFVVSLTHFRAFDDGVFLIYL